MRLAGWGWEALTDDRDGMEDPTKGPREVRRPSRRAMRGQEAIAKAGRGRGAVKEVRDGSGSPPGGPIGLEALP